MTTQQVIEFTLNEEQYCINLEYVTEVVSRSKNDVSPIPDSPPHVEGELNLRGGTTKVIDPRARLLPDGHEENEVSKDRIMLFDAERTTGGRSGWAVTDVLQILSIDPESVEAVGQEKINGILTREDGRIVWIEPEPISAET